MCHSLCDSSYFLPVHKNGMSHSSRIPGFNKYCHKWRALLSPPLHFVQLSLFPQNPTYNIPNVGLFRVSVMPSIKCSCLLFLDSRPKYKLQCFREPTGESVAPACGESGQPRARRGRTPQRKVLSNKRQQSGSSVALQIEDTVLSCLSYPAPNSPRQFSQSALNRTRKLYCPPFVEGEGGCGAIITLLKATLGAHRWQDPAPAGWERGVETAGAGGAGRPAAEGCGRIPGSPPHPRTLAAPPRPLSGSTSRAPRTRIAQGARWRREARSAWG